MRYIWILPFLTSLYAMYGLPISSDSAKDAVSGSLGAITLAAVSVAWAVVPICLCFAVTRIFEKKKKDS
ncbi:hypothetical protein ACTVKO_09890 [Serratia nevei]|uniref:hypothetical protein n=1 Tax=Serratia nevei TaxID=2703794 RepID=UPI003FA7E5A2